MSETDKSGIINAFTNAPLVEAYQLEPNGIAGAPLEVQWTNGSPSGDPDEPIIELEGDRFFDLEEFVEGKVNGNKLDLPDLGVRFCFFNKSPFRITPVLAADLPDPSRCPFCGGEELVTIGDWMASSTMEENQNLITEYQCLGKCEGRSFWA